MQKQWWGGALFGAGIALCTVLLYKHRTKATDKLKLRSGFCSLVGNTPLLHIASLSEELGVCILAKAEFLNPGGSVKDRIANYILHKALKTGVLQQGGTVYEGTSGSTGISLAQVCNNLGLHCIIFMPSDVSPEKINLLRALKAQVVLCEPVSVTDDNHMCKKAFAAYKRHIEDHGNGTAYYCDQFENPDNIMCHINTTGPEIIEQLNGQLPDCFVHGAGTGGTIGGITLSFLSDPERKTFKGKDRTTVILADPQGSALADSVKTKVLFTARDKEGSRKRIIDDTIVEGVGLNRLTYNFRLALPHIPFSFNIDDPKVVRMANSLLQKEGLFLGPSSALNCCAIVEGVRQGLIKQGDTVLTIFCDSGMRHLSKMYNPEYLKKRRDFVEDSLERKEILAFE